MGHLRCTSRVTPVSTQRLTQLGHQIAHIDGLNLSRAWMLEGIAHGLGPDDRRTGALLAAANSHREAALPKVTGAHYEGAHWLGTFAIYLTSHAGLQAAPTPPP